MDSPTGATGERWRRWWRWRASGGRAVANLAGQAGPLSRRHWALLLLLLAGGVLRLLVMIGYAPGFWYQGDSATYLGDAVRHQPGTIRPYGYSFFLNLLLDWRSTRLIVGIQHLMGIALALGAYVFLYRRGVSRLVCALAAAPLLLDARTVAIEHYLLAETLFTLLVVFGMVALCWRPTPGWLGTLVAAGAFSWAALTRSIGLAALAVPVLYLILRRVPWRRTLAFVAIVGLSLGGYLVWYDDNHGEYAFNAYGGRFLWSRTMSFVDCEKLDLTAEERPLCPQEPIDARLPPDVYLWTRAPYAIEQGERYNQAYDSFARKAIKAQPGSYAWTIATDLGRIFTPGPYPTRRIACLAGSWSLLDHRGNACQAFMAPWNPAQRSHGPAISEGNHRLMAPLHTYSDLATVPGVAIPLCLLLTIGLACYRPRSSSWRDHLDPLAWTVLAVGMIVGSVATSAVDPRYAVPSLPLAVVGTALAWGRASGQRKIQIGRTGGAEPADISAADQGPGTATKEVVR